MAQPILYFTFADQQDAHLPLLKQEIDDLKEILRPLENREFIRIEREESTTTADVVKTLGALPDRICIFHYSGHAAGKSLDMEAGPAHAQGLAQLLGAQKDLVLVFLNGCSTRAQVELLFAAGVKAVIATSVPVGDRRAALFSATFYRALANKRSLKLAFEFARAALETDYRDAPHMEIRRGIGLEETGETEQMPWGLYVQEQYAGEVLGWRLPYYREIGLPNHMIQYIGRQFKLNRYIVLVLDEMCRYNKDIYSQMVEVRNGQEVKKDSSTYLDLVIQNFPWVIGSQIQLLRQCAHADKERLQQLLSTYIITGMTLYYALLSDFWEARRNAGFDLPGTWPASLQQTKASVADCDFLARFCELAAILVREKIDFFIPEMRSFYQALQDRGGHVYKAWQHLEKMRAGLAELLPDQHEKSCLTTEQALALILQQAAFLADYHMLTVRNISIDNPRYNKEVYELNFGMLNAIVNTSLSLYEDTDKRRKENYSNCKSIVLTPDENDLRHALNLSPFVIDKNTFLQNEHIDLFLYGYEEAGRHHYLAVKHSFFVALANEKGTDIIDTGMTAADFAEGRNIKAPDALLEDPDFDAAFGFADTTAQTAESPLVFGLLEGQFEQLYTDLSS